APFISCLLVPTANGEKEFSTALKAEQTATVPSATWSRTRPAICTAPPVKAAQDAVAVSSSKWLVWVEYGRRALSAASRVFPTQALLITGWWPALRGLSSVQPCTEAMT